MVLSLATNGYAGMDKGKIEKASGRCLVKRGIRSHAAKSGMIIKAGDELVSGDNSRVEIYLTKTGRIILTGKTRFKVEEENKEEERTSKVSLFFGNLWCKAQSLLSGETFEIKTPTASAGVRGTEYGLKFDPEEKVMTTWVLEGEVYNVNEDGDFYTLTAGMVGEFGEDGFSSRYDPDIVQSQHKRLSLAPKKKNNNPMRQNMQKVLKKAKAKLTPETEEKVKQVAAKLEEKVKETIGNLDLSGGSVDLDLQKLQDETKKIVSDLLLEADEKTLANLKEVAEELLKEVDSEIKKQADELIKNIQAQITMLGQLEQQYQMLKSDTTMDASVKMQQYMQLQAIANGMKSNVQAYNPDNLEGAEKELAEAYFSELKALYQQAVSKVDTLIAQVDQEVQVVQQPTTEIPEGVYPPGTVIPPGAIMESLLKVPVRYKDRTYLLEVSKESLTDSEKMKRELEAQIYLLKQGKISEYDLMQEQKRLIESKVRETKESDLSPATQVKDSTGLYLPIIR
jgi:ElaB/YqjD/DUF883 family membrane-anchored ribosome-binding protein